MFNIVKRRDFMLGRNVTREEAEQAARDYGKDYVAVQVEGTRYVETHQTTIHSLSAGDEGS